MIKVFWRPYLRLAAYLKPYKGRFALGLFFGVLAGLVNGLIPLVLYMVGALPSYSSRPRSKPSITFPTPPR